MKSSLLPIVLALSAHSTIAAHLTIGPDISASNPLVLNQNYADAIAARLSERISTMNYGDTITLKTLGDGGMHHIRAKRMQIQRRNPPQAAAQKVASAIKAYPKQNLGDGATAIMGFVEHGEFKCDQPGSEVWLLTDGIESLDFDGRKLLDGKRLPATDVQSLKGCDVIMIGIGRTSNGARLPRQMISNLRNAWERWLKQAGAKSVRVMVNP